MKSYQCNLYDKDGKEKSNILSSSNNFYRRQTRSFEDEWGHYVIIFDKCVFIAWNFLFNYELLFTKNSTTSVNRIEYKEKKCKNYNEECISFVLIYR